MKAVRNQRPDHEAIANIIPGGSRVLDLGCGEGDLLGRLAAEKNIRGQGIEIDEAAIYQCVARGLSVFHGDIDTGLSEYTDKSFDYVILNQTFQQVRKPDAVLREALRVGNQVIVGFPNFATIDARWRLAVRGKVPVTPALPYQWYDTPNIHFLSIVDFKDYCIATGIEIQKAVYFGVRRRVRFFPNLRAQTAIFLIRWRVQE